jgi:hypothetical protein
MKPLSIAMTAAALAGALAGLEGLACAQGAQPAASARAHKESPLACDRLALSPAERKRHFEELGPALLARETGVRELADGYALSFPPDAATVRMLAEWAFQERACCPFLDIAIALEREDGPIWLRLTGRKGVKEFIAADAAAWIGKQQGAAR